MSKLVWVTSSGISRTYEGSSDDIEALFCALQKPRPRIYGRLTLLAADGQKVLEEINAPCDKAEICSEIFNWQS